MLTSLPFGSLVKLISVIPVYGIVASKPNDDNEYIIYDLSKNTYKLIYRSNCFPIDNTTVIKYYSKKVKIKNFEESANIFNYRKIKSKLVGKEFPFKLEENYVCKIDGISRNTIVITTPDSKKLRFVESDCEYTFTLPKITLQLHKPNKTIKVGSFVKLVNSKKLPIPKNTICKVINLKSRNHGYVDKKTGKLINNTNIVYLDYQGKQYPTLIKNVKKVINDTNYKQTMPF
jgi:hypothetical protein